MRFWISAYAAMTDERDRWCPHWVRKKRNAGSRLRRTCSRNQPRKYGNYFVFPVEILLTKCSYYVPLLSSSLEGVGFATVILMGWMRRLRAFVRRT
jgi:hypothetical protein